eukprot:PhM_4_TR13373/c0_g1_i1/m.11014/K20362/YIF1; protein transport protein YIF1
MSYEPFYNSNFNSVVSREDGTGSPAQQPVGGKGFGSATPPAQPAAMGGGYNSSSTLLGASAATGGLDPLMMQMGQNLLQNRGGQITSAVYTPIEYLRPYFRIDNGYVAKKLGVVVQPFGRNFVRQRCGIDDDVARSSAEYFPPVDDVAAPDLYIPVMSLLTYVLIGAFATTSGYSPEMLMTTVFRSFLGLVAEVALVKLAGVVTFVPHMLFWLDVAAWCGYKYVAICISLLVRLALGSSSGMLVTVLSGYCAVTAAYFVLRTLTPYCSRDGKVVIKTVPFLYGVAAMQLPLFYWFAFLSF